MEQAIQNGEVAGVNLLVKKYGHEALYCESGFADLESQIPIRRDTIFRLYSMSKPITAAAAMILLERGEIDLFQPVSDFLPSFSDMQMEQNGISVACTQPILLFDLLRMTSGLVYPEPGSIAGHQAEDAYQTLLSRLNTDQELTTRQFADLLAEGVLAFEPGSTFHYGTSADVLAAVIEVVTAKRFGDFLEEEFLKPLEMKDTGFWVPEENRHRLAKVYEAVESRNHRTQHLYTGNHLGILNNMDHRPAYESGGAGLVSTLDDYMNFAEMLLNEGTFHGRQILKPATVRYMTQAQLTDTQQPGLFSLNGLTGYSYGNLMRVCKKPSQSGLITCEGEYGWDGWLGAYFANFPKERMTILVGMQKKDAGTTPLTRKLRNVILTSLL